MPWTSGADFAAAHNKSLKGAAATKAKEIAEAMIARGVPEGTAIATANAHGNRMMRYRHASSRRQRGESG